jgi:hypothetical protein
MITCHYYIYGLGKVGEIPGYLAANKNMLAPLMERLR